MAYPPRERIARINADFCVRFGALLRQKRCEKMLPQRVVAAAIGMSRNQFSAVENGKQWAMQLAQIALLARFLQIRPDVLFEYAEDEEVSPPHLC